MNDSSPSNYPPNSKIKKETVVETKKVETSEKPKLKPLFPDEQVIHRKKGLGKKIAETFTGDDAQSVGEYVLFDVIIPAAKTMISDAVGQGVERMLFGETRRPRSSAGAGRTNYTNYNRFSPSSGSPGRAFEPDGPAGRGLSKRARTTHDFGEVILPDRGKAEVVLERMGDTLDMYGLVTVTDFYDLVQITASYTDDKWGWYDLRGARVIRERAGYLIDLPQPQPID